MSLLMRDGGEDSWTDCDFTELTCAFLLLENIISCLDKFHGVLCPSPANDFVMQVRTRAPSSVPQQADFRAKFYHLSFLDVKLIQMTIAGLDSLVVAYFDQLSVFSLPTCICYHPGEVGFGRILTQIKRAEAGRIPQKCQEAPM